MGQVLTGTICPFPYTFNKTTIDLIKKGGINQNQLNVKDDCKQLYADYLSPDYQGLQYTIMAFSLLTMLLFSVRMFYLNIYAKTVVNKSMVELRQFRFFLIGLVGSTLLFIESIDLFSFSNRFPKEIYFLCDELLTIVLYILVVQLVDFWAMLALAMRVGAGTGLPKREKMIFYVVVVINFLGCIIIGMSASTQYFLLEGIKTFTGGILLLLFLGRSFTFILRIQRTLLNSFGVTGSANGSGSKSKKSETTRLAIRTLRRKFFMFSFVVILAAAVQIYNAFDVWGMLNDPGVPVDLRWKYLIEEQIDPAQFVIKIVFLLAFLTLAHFFTVPTSEIASPSKKSALGSSSNEGGYSMNKIIGRPPFGSSLVASGNAEHPNLDKQNSYATSHVEKQTSFYTGQDEDKAEEAEPRPSDFKTMLNNPTKRAKFARFVSTKFASESVRFYEAATAFEKIEDPEERKRAGEEIIRNHFVDNAPLPITLKDAQRRKILQEKDFAPDAFKSAVQETYDLLNTNFYIAFAQNQNLSV